MRTLHQMLMAAALIVVATPALAVDAHHPTDPPAATSAMPTAPKAPSAPSPMNPVQPGMTGMMGGGMPMMQMMSPEQMDGRVTKLKSDLQIGAAQEKQWDALADVLRADARSMGDMMTMMQSGMMSSEGGSHLTALDRLETHERMLNARLESLRRVKAALPPLYSALDERQKQIIDRSVMPGMMGPR